MADHATNFIVLNQRDNVATARRTLKGGTSVAVGDSCIELRQTIPGGHKVALASIDAGKELLKYGQIIGFAKEAIELGDWVNCLRWRGIETLFTVTPVPAALLEHAIISLFFRA